MRRYTAIALVLLLAVSLGASPAGLAAPGATAAILEVGTNAACPYHTITAAIAAAHPGDTIKVENTVFNERLVVTKNLTLAGGYNKALSACLTLTGLNHTTLHPDIASPDRLLVVQNATVTVHWFIFENSISGGGVRVTNATLNLDNSKIQNNTATWGGGMSVARSTANLTDVEFNDNTASSGSGGGMDIWGAPPASTVSLTRVTFRRNHAASNGGAMNIEHGAQVTADDWLAIGIDGTTINHADQNGGGAYIHDSGSRLAINSGSTLSTVSSNTANGHGGGIYVDGGQVVLNGTIDPMFGERLMLSSNTADGDGGGLYATNGAAVQADEMFIFQNEAQNGGGLYLDGSTFAGSDVRIQYNGAAGQGGGLWAGNGSAVSLSNGSEVGGWGGIKPNGADEGGGLYAGSGSSVTVDASAIRGNQAVQHGCGACVVGGSSFTASHGTLIERNEMPYGCVEGGGIYADGLDTQVSIDASEVATNTAITRGGGLYVGGGVATIRNGSVVWNNETLDFVDGGGGAYVLGASTTLNVSHSTFRDNWSATDGGGILNQSATVNLDGASIERNHAQANGGGIYSWAGHVQAGRSRIDFNEALTGDGGGLHSHYGILDVESSSLDHNQAVGGSGGAISTYRVYTSVRESYLGHNSSAGEGSALYSTGMALPGDAAVEIVNCFIVDNVTTVASTEGPPGSGSSVYAQGVVVTANYNTFAHENLAPHFGVYAGDGSTVEMRNNIIANFVVGIRRPAGGTGSATAWYTLYSGNSTNYDPAVASFNEVPGAPAFVGGGDYHLTSASDAIDAGTDIGVYVDVDGDVRPWGNGYDVGADEWGKWALLPLVMKNH
jgi:hypothetical protein